MRPRWSRIGCALLVALGVLGFSTSVAAAAEIGTPVVGRASAGTPLIAAPNALAGPTIVGGPLAR